MLGKSYLNLIMILTFQAEEGMHRSKGTFYLIKLLTLGCNPTYFYNQINPTT